MAFRTPLTDLFGIRLPIIAGGLHWLANADYVAAAAKAGMIGFITAASFPDTDALRDEIRRCRDLAEGKPFGVNVSMLPKLVQGERTDAVFDAIIAEGVAFVETSGRNPEAYIPRLHAAGITVMHKVPAVRFARKAEAVGVDAVTVVGAECGGHPGLDLVGTIVQTVLAARGLSIPLAVGGGIGSGEQLVAALAMGADGVTIGTRFLVAEEIWAHQGFKERLLAADETDTALILSSLRNTMRVLRNETSDRVAAIEAAGQGNLDTLLPHVSGKLGRVAYETGDASQGALSVGQSVAMADRVEPLAAIVARLEEEAERALDRLSVVTGRSLRNHAAAS
ncbi:nitronate monooxygenase [Azospirillum sp.]|uniref:NAD(P)H-dependent flavin oxidoreductase n=1 Tax=Azospirillum sp. TaxID=34012 RepID=UPI00263482C1|nr:nitronate monooxygenase [Azospirillum sp.]